MSMFNHFLKKGEFDLDPADYRLIGDLIGLHKEIERAYVFGSRARGNHLYNSDIDIGLVGEAVTNRVAGRVKNLLEGTHLPHYFDVLDVASLSDPDFRRHILEEGVLIYDRETYEPPEHHRARWKSIEI